MQYNIAVCKTLKGQLDQAASLLKQIWQARGPNCKVPAHIIMLVLYIELQLGKNYLIALLLQRRYTWLLISNSKIKSFLYCLYNLQIKTLVQEPGNSVFYIWEIKKLC